MSGPANPSVDGTSIPQFPERLGHPAPLWMLFMTEFWERFAFYGMRWALTLYIVAQFYGGSGTGEAPANDVYGAYLALIYAASLFGGYAADQLIGYQRSILIGAVIMAAGLFVIMVPSQDVFLLGLALVIVGNGLFKPTSRPWSASSMRRTTAAAMPASRSSTWASTSAASCRRS